MGGGGGCTRVLVGGEQPSVRGVVGGVKQCRLPPICTHSACTLYSESLYTSISSRHTPNIILSLPRSLSHSHSLSLSFSRSLFHFARLEAGWNSFGNIGGTAIGTALLLNRSITQLGLSQNRIGCDGAVVLAEGKRATDYRL